MRVCLLTNRTPVSRRAFVTQRRLAASKGSKLYVTKEVKVDSTDILVVVRRSSLLSKAPIHDEELFNPNYYANHIK